MVNTNALNYWRQRRIQREDLIEFCKRFDTEYFISLLTFCGDSDIEVIVSKRFQNEAAGHAATCVDYFREVTRTWDGPALNGSVVLWHEDGMWGESRHSRLVPIMSFGRNVLDPYTFLVPDPAYMESRAYSKEKEETEGIDLKQPFESKEPTIYWRGAATGYLEQDDWKEQPRITLGLLAKEYNKTAVLNAGLSSVPRYKDLEHSKRIEDLKIMKGYAPFSEFLKYRYQIDLDGMSCAWMSCFRKLQADCVMFKASSHLMQWYYPRMIPWKHFIPISPDMSDLIDQYEWLEQNQNVARQIASNATELASSLSYEASLKETGQLLSELFSYQQ